MQASLIVQAALLAAVILVALGLFVCVSAVVSRVAGYGYTIGSERARTDLRRQARARRAARAAAIDSPTMLIPPVRPSDHPAVADAAELDRQRMAAGGW